MGKKEVVFGKKEKHTVEISWSKLFGDFTIKIDGQSKKDIPFRDMWEHGDSIPLSALI